MDAGPKQDLWNLLPVIIVLLLGAAYFAVMETAFASASRIRLKAAADHGNRRAEQAMYVLDHFDQAITTLLIGTNILHLTIATLVTVAVQRQWGMWAVTAGTLITTAISIQFSKSCLCITWEIQMPTNTTAIKPSPATNPSKC